MASRPIDATLHGVADYSTGALLQVLPKALDIEGSTGAKVLRGAGAVHGGYSLFTDYELGVVKRIQVPMHLLLDGIAGVVLIASPWVLGFDEKVWIPHVAAGALEVVAAFFTNTIPAYERRRAG